MKNVQKDTNSSPPLFMLTISQHKLFPHFKVKACTRTFTICSEAPNKRIQLEKESTFMGLSHG